MRPALGGRTYLYFYASKEKEAIKKRDDARIDLLRRGP
jgi:hypothetical protein